MAASFIALLLFLAGFNLFGLARKSRQVIEITQSSMQVVRNSELDDYQKEKAMQGFARELFILFLGILFRTIGALAIPFGFIWLLELFRLTTVNQVIEASLSFEFIIATIVISAVYFYLISKRSRH